AAAAARAARSTASPSSRPTAAVNSSTSRTVTAAPAAASDWAMAAQLLISGPCRIAIEQSRFERVVSAHRRQRAADEGDAGKPIEQPQLAERIGEIDIGCGGERLAACAPRDFEALTREHRRDLVGAG